MEAEPEYREQLRNLYAAIGQLLTNGGTPRDRQYRYRSVEV